MENLNISRHETFYALLNKMKSTVNPYFSKVVNHGSLKEVLNRTFLTVK